MISADSSLAVVEELFADETSSYPSGTPRKFLGYSRGYNEPAPVEEANLLNLPPEELLIAPNRDAVDQTLEGRVNGTSATLFKSDQLVFIPPRLSTPKKKFRVLQKWEGYVIEVEQDTFFARLVPIVGEGPDQEAEIYLEEIEPDDRILIEPGAVFYWSIGYSDKPAGRERVSLIRFRRLPTWTRRELEIARTKAAKLRDLFDVE